MLEVEGGENMSKIGLDQFAGCIMGLALGDALGAPFEGGMAERLLWRLIGKTRSGHVRWTDDTQMTVDIIEILLEKGMIDSDALAERFAMGYRWSRGYGPGTAKMLKRIRRGEDWRSANTSIYRDGSFGNGAAMRAPVIGIFYSDRITQLDQAATNSAIVTHAHKEAVEGAISIARATAYIALGFSSLDVFGYATEHFSSEGFRLKTSIAKEWLKTNRDAPVAEVRNHLGNGIAARDSCITAVYLSLRFRDADFMELHRFITRIGGDADTIGAMAGAIWGAANGASRLPPKPIENLEQHMYLLGLAEKLYRQRLSPD